MNDLTDPSRRSNSYSEEHPAVDSRLVSLFPQLPQVAYRFNRKRKKFHFRVSMVCVIINAVFPSGDLIQDIPGRILVSDIQFLKYPSDFMHSRRNFSFSPHTILSHHLHSQEKEERNPAPRARIAAPQRTAPNESFKRLEHSQIPQPQRRAQLRCNGPQSKIPSSDPKQSCRKFHVH